MHVSFLPFSCRSGVRLIPFVLQLQIRLLYQPLMIDEYGALVGWLMAGKELKFCLITWCHNPEDYNMKLYFYET